MDDKERQEWLEKEKAWQQERSEWKKWESETHKRDKPSTAMYVIIILNLLILIMSIAVFMKR